MLNVNSDGQLAMLIGNSNCKLYKDTRKMDVKTVKKSG